MGDIADDDLLNDDEEFDHEGYNLSDKEEDALLEGEDYDGGHLSNEYVNPSNVHADKKQSHEDSDDLEDDVLDLDIEEDFQDVDDKTFEEQKPSEKKQEGKFSTERPATSSNTTTNKVSVPVNVRAQVTKKAPAVKPQSKNNEIKVQNTKKAPPRIEKRGRGTGRGNFQSRGNFPRNNSLKERRERRNTVFINPKYEGIVHINENNVAARLAWDNSSYQQNNSHYIQPWAAGNIPGNCEPSYQDPSLLINNLVSEMVNISQTPANLFPVPAVQPNQPLNFFEPPQSQPLQPLQLTFQHIPQWDDSYNMQNQNQISNHEAFPPQTSHPPPYQSTRPSFNSQSLTDRYQNDSNSYSYGNYSYNRSNSQDYSLATKKSFTSSNYNNRNMNYTRPLVNRQNQYENSKIGDYKTSFSNQDNYKNNFSNQENYKSNYSNQNSYKNNFSNEDDYYKSNYSNSANNNYQTGTNYLGNNFENRKPNYSKPSAYNGPTTTYQTGNLYKTTDSKEVGYNRTTNTVANRNLDQNKDASQNNYNTSNLNSKQPFNQNQNNYYKNDYNRTNVGQSYNRNFTNRNLTNQQNSNRRPALIEKVEVPEKKLKSEENTNKLEKRNEETKKTVESTKQEVSSNNVINNEEEDEEMRLYRLKIEEQKREREKVLKMKEERRKMMLQQQKKKEESAETEKQQQQPVMTTNVPNKNYKPSGFTTEPQQQRNLSTVPQQQQTYYHQQSVNHIPVLTTNESQYLNVSNSQSTEDEDELPNFTFKVSNDLQKSAPSSATVAKTEASSSSFMSNRVVVVKNSVNQKGGALPNSSIAKTVPVNNEASKKNADVGQGLSSFFNNRKVLKKDNTLVNTRLVVISNLAASTTQNKLVAMTRGIGEIQKLQMDKQERQATILFKSVASAHAFFKKYQRHMLDLSVIEVKLEPLI